jgi:hypothetical protein
MASFLLLPENQAEYVRYQRQACAAQMVATGVRHAPAAAAGGLGATTVRYYRSLQWSQNQHPSQSTIQTPTSSSSLLEF